MSSAGLRFRPAPDSLWSRLSPSGRATLTVLAAAAIGILGIAERDLGRAIVGMLGFAIFIVVAVTGRLLAITLIVVWLVMLGFIRRLLIPFAGWSPQDPLLLVAPAAAVVLWGTSVRNQRDQRLARTAITSIGLFLALWVVAQIFNPHEPSLLLGAEGALFYLGPLVWVFVGRRFTDIERQRVLDTVFWMTIPVLMLGFYQTFVGLLPFELHWVGVSGIGPSIFLPGYKIRPFSTLVSPQEYGIFLSFSIAIIWSRLLYARKHRGWLLLMAVAAFIGLFYQASRETFSLFLISFLAINLVRARSAVLALSAVSVVSFSALLMLGGSVGQGSSSSADPQEATASGAAVLAQHQLQFFSNPTGGTTGMHIDRIRQAMDNSVSNPLGLGPSLGTLAGAKGGQGTAGPEADFADVAQDLGLPAEAAFLALVAIGLAAAYRLCRYRPCPRHLAWFGILVAGLMQWLNGALYCTAALTFIVLGSVATESRELVPEPAARTTAALSPA